jgi:hypothetical protein
VGRVLNLNDFQPSIFTGRLVKMSVNADVLLVTQNDARVYTLTA